MTFDGALTVRQSVNGVSRRVTDNRSCAAHRSCSEIKLASHGEIEKSLKPRQREEKWLVEGK